MKHDKTNKYDICISICKGYVQNMNNHVYKYINVKVIYSCVKCDDSY